MGPEWIWAALWVALVVVALFAVVMLARRR
jgi:hypothetical protein